MNTLYLDFVGGPFDGHRQAMDTGDWELRDMVAFPVNENVLRLLAGEPTRPQQPVRSMAVYRLRPGEACYEFVGAWAPSDFNLDTSSL